MNDDDNIDDDNIDYDKLATMVAHKLRATIDASLRGQAALDDAWFNERITEYIIRHPDLITRYVCNTVDFEQQFKAKLKSAINTIY